MKPIVAVICDTNQQGLHLFHQAGDKYLQALRACADVTPVLLPAISGLINAADIVSFADGILFTGGYSNIQRERYSQPPAPEGEHEDPARDAVTLSLIPEVINAGLPLLAICRGFQELNVALGGTLYPRLHETEGRMDHRENTDDPIDKQYGLSHSVSLLEGGTLMNIIGEPEFMVNSVHGQGIAKLATGLTVEAMADDDTIEAATVDAAKGFALALQWHPEWEAAENPQSLKIFSAFGNAVRAHKLERP